MASRGNPALAKVPDVPVGGAADQRATSRETLSVDAGVVIASRGGYFCVPFERLGLQDDAQLREITTTCDCVKPRVVQYRTPAGGSARAVLFEFVPESSGATPARQIDSPDDTPHGLPSFRPALLNVVCKLSLQNGNVINSVVQFVHSELIGSDSNVSE